MLAILTEYLLDCLWILSQVVIGFTAVMLMVIVCVVIRNTWHEIMRRAEEEAWKKKK